MTKIISGNVILPNFLYIGAAKSGSTWIYEMLRQHPEVFLPLVKDTKFFDYYYDRGIGWYLRYFNGGRGKKVVGEIAHDYFYIAESASRIKRWLPDVKFLCCLRDPVENLFSSYLFHQTTEISKGMSFEEYAFNPEYSKRCDYYNNLVPFYELYPNGNFLVLFFDELKQNPLTFIKKIYDFLGVDNQFIPVGYNQKILAARKPRSYLISHLGFKLAQYLRIIGYGDLVGRVKHSLLFERTLYKKIDNKAMPSIETREKLLEYFKQRLEKLPELTGREIPPVWFKKTHF